MRTLVSEHEIDEIPIAWTLLLTLIALPAARLALVALPSCQSFYSTVSGEGRSGEKGRRQPYTDLAFSTI